MRHRRIPTEPNQTERKNDLRYKWIPRSLFPVVDQVLIANGWLMVMMVDEQQIAKPSMQCISCMEKKFKAKNVIFSRVGIFRDQCSVLHYSYNDQCSVSF